MGGRPVARAVPQSILSLGRGGASEMAALPLRHNPGFPARVPVKTLHELSDLLVAWFSHLQLSH
jgi:hypothetical protein